MLTPTAVDEVADPVGDQGEPRDGQREMVEVAVNDLLSNESQGAAPDGDVGLHRKMSPKIRKIAMMMKTNPMKPTYLASRL